MKNKTMDKLLGFVLILALFTATLVGAAEAPAPKQLVKNAQLNGEIAFAKQEVINLFDAPKKVAFITFATMPDLQCGTIKQGDQELLILENVSVRDLDKLRFLPVKDYAGETVLEIKALDKKNNHIGTASLKLCILSERNFAPSAKDGTCETQKNITVTGKLFGADPDRDALTFKLLKAPKIGTVTLSDETRSYVYCPKENKTGNDAFTYQVFDCYGNASEVATMKVRVNKPQSALTYSDMTNHWAHYPAIKLGEMGVISGVQVGGNRFFNPDETIPRGEFMVMLLQVAKPDLSVNTVSQTDFRDDETIPTWMKGYVSAAVSNHIVTGQSGDNGPSFDALAPVTRAQACVMLNNALAPKETMQTLSHFSDIAAIPTWAIEAVTAMSTCGILNGFDDGTVRAESCLTRAQACSLLWDAINYEKESKSASAFNILTWFGK